MIGRQRHRQVQLNYTRPTQFFFPVYSVATFLDITIRSFRVLLIYGRMLCKFDFFLLLPFSQLIPHFGRVLAGDQRRNGRVQSQVPTGFKSPLFEPGLRLVFFPRIRQLNGHIISCIQFQFVNGVHFQFLSGNSRDYISNRTERFLCNAFRRTASSVPPLRQNVNAKRIFNCLQSFLKLSCH